MWQTAALRVVRTVFCAPVAEDLCKNFICSGAHRLQLLRVQGILNDYDLQIQTKHDQSLQNGVPYAHAFAQCQRTPSR